MAKAKLTDVTGKIVDLLAPFESDERMKIVQAAFVFLGETTTNAFGDGGKKGNSENAGADMENANSGISEKAKSWMQSNSINNAQISQVFHISNGSIDIIASKIPGKSLKEQTVNAYVLQGIAKFILTGEPNFDDDSARSFCQSAGCYDVKNHSSYLASKGNKFSGSKGAGWKLTTPGLKDGADLVKQSSS